MHLLVLGATGKTGALAYQYALELGNHVTILVRDASKINPHANLTVVEGSAMLEADMDRAFAAAAGVPVDTVLQCLNPHRAANHPWAKFLGPPRLMADSTALAAHALRRQGHQLGGHKPRLIAMNALGAGQSRKAAPIITKFLIDYSNIGWTYVDHDAVDAEIEQNCGQEVDWTIVFAVALSGGGGGLIGGPSGLKPVRTFAHTDPGSNWAITRESCARWMVDVATGRLGDEFSNKRVIVSN
ncbi:conserved hypothetical protein [Talaromyces stipitatus ATCC 10500]|uniref:NAD(P)-binding domain-containing protein n=1 Tax=Talaromyces stipitatus (strain ATCC 10500 / CBS 375.48 / QM 6759 / NRRL 1006) TaxID=441959 RepID=B8M5C5_TALSN|nr:uncharacterized protein TSTA_030020 [Talaromyces stipitatus ATCC 10500]EED19731.1 conserved hypothetical protein [Talaromyces stipitatus ATCC 10500]